MVVYKDYDQEALDMQFNNRLHVPDYANYFSRWESMSRDTEQQLQVIKDISYGDAEREKLDIYPSLLPRSKTLVFIHGGYWQMLDKSMFQFMAGRFHSYGVTTVLLNYPLAPHSSIDQIVMSCRKAMHWLYHNISTFNGDRDQVFVAGHSAGGHLASMLMTTDSRLSHTGVLTHPLKGICTASGLFNLVPIQLSFVNKVLKMDIESAERNSPVKLKPVNACPVILAVGQCETREFKDQSRELYTRWKEQGIDIQLLELPAEHHYSIGEKLADAQSALHHALVDLMHLE